ncbi:hypothetical protein GE21DRAFT_7157 [Neurospora crassa]|uniref:Uncharacterized protein n=1 Tax=Neurospora crassa (strain ATCC 24698 / 74-OR23-1A / CBS 708.71 / DSM 1257 / FGSC 987) TaxID=367110 RepID=Q7S250_NEUCR|nr:hypothetical protein NCU04559 [Neurospora crassa OR74A]EAA29422.1 hypothetical protein NCU04559 [Neurospora crassa OR74A]KHE83898.1 hypothetical protein GE21DRAFT_7157 [Neurospora crassa]|eukprot:XP_958658.1 hypothetical protein NCU04559 [Neurospora crassa OR74A]
MDGNLLDQLTELREHGQADRLAATVRSVMSLVQNSGGGGHSARVVRQVRTIAANGVNWGWRGVLLEGVWPVMAVETVAWRYGLLSSNVVLSAPRSYLLAV